MEYIESLSNSKIKLVASLHQRKKREKEGLFVCEGLRLVEEAQASSWEKQFAFVTNEAIKRTRIKKLVDVLEDKKCPVFVINEGLFRKISATVEPQGILLVLKKKEMLLENISTNADFFVVLDGIQDAGNAGSIIRSADAVAANCIIFLDGTVDAYADKTMRSTMGSIFHLPIIENVTIEEFVKFCKGRKIKIFCTALDSTAKTVFDYDYGEKKALVFGNEGKGASESILDVSEHVYIPMRGKTESLNVAAAAAVVLYDVYKKNYFQQA